MAVSRAIYGAPSGPSAGCRAWPRSSWSRSAIGIGANTAVFTWVQARVLQPLPAVPESHRLQLIEPTRRERRLSRACRGANLAICRSGCRRFSTSSRFRTTPLNVGVATQLERAFGFFVSGNYFSGLGLRPASGPAHRARRMPRGRAAEPVIVISSRVLAGAACRCARRHRPDRFRVNDRPLTVVGVAPRRDSAARSWGVVFDLWMPATLAPALVDGSQRAHVRDERAYSAIGRLQPGVTRAQAQAELSAAMQDLARAYP